MRRSLLTAVLLVLLAAGVGACGDSGEEKAKEAAGKAACTALQAGAPAGNPVALPQGFPQEQDVTFVSTATAGPTSITTGSSPAELDAAYKVYKADLAKAPYSVTKSEKDEHDAEVNFESADTTGQVKLQECDGGKLAVQVTARPK